jgi:putative membrane protein
LAVATPPLAIRTVYLAARRRFAEHRRLVRFTLPVWMYVSVTGVAVYLMLYHPPG